jgi:hypothetical protein
MPFNAPIKLKNLSINSFISDHVHFVGGSFYCKTEITTGCLLKTPLSLNEPSIIKYACPDCLLFKQEKQSSQTSISRISGTYANNRRQNEQAIQHRILPGIDIHRLKQLFRQEQGHEQ